MNYNVFSYIGSTPCQISIWLHWYLFLVI